MPEALSRWRALHFVLRGDRAYRRLQRLEVRFRVDASIAIAIGSRCAQT
jgi:hypothetical protein